MKEIKGKIRMLVLPVPFDSDEFLIIHEGTRVAFFLPMYKRFDLPKGNKGKHTVIGKFSSLTEEQCKELVESIFVEIPPSPSNDMSGDYDIAYVDYENIGEFAGWGGDAGCYRHAKSSLKSLLLSNGYNEFDEDYLLIKISDEE